MSNKVERRFELSREDARAVKNKSTQELNLYLDEVLAQGASEVESEKFVDGWKEGSLQQATLMLKAVVMVMQEKYAWEPEQIDTFTEELVSQVAILNAEETLEQ